MSTSTRLTMRLATACVLGATVIALAGCGSSKPGYCSKRTNLENSVKGLTNLNPSAGISGLQTQVQKIESDASALVGSAKSDFPSETSAISSAVDQFTSAVKGLASSQTAAQIGKVANAASNVVSSVNSFVSASGSKCS
ncbi:MAG: hypothetical protein JO181_13375 [Solirubrobacterales bacterium]|nr:hypothetical protein [Solirubrobacterales bacterium]